MTTYYSDYTELDINVFFSTPTELDINYFNSDWTEIDIYTNTPGGVLAWTKSSPASSSAHAIRLHQTVEATIPSGSPTHQINPETEFVFKNISGQDIFSPHFKSPYVYLNNSDDPRIMAITNKILSFVYGDGKFNEKNHKIKTQYIPKKIIVGKKNSGKIAGYCYFSDNNVYAFEFNDELNLSSSSSSTSSSVTISTSSSLSSSSTRKHLSSESSISSSTQLLPSSSSQSLSSSSSSSMSSGSSTSLSSTSIEKNDLTLPRNISNGSPYAVSAYPNNTDAWLAFDHRTTTKWSAITLPAYLIFDFGFGNSKSIDRYLIEINHPDSTKYPKDWVVEGSDDKLIWTIIDSRINETSWGSVTYRFFNLGSMSSSYRYYRLYITKSPSGLIDIVDWKLFNT